ncbi:redox-regulated ATPase YchF [Haloferax volcanii]|jgi:ribosome-binding ATPase YchF (GTP1/OBG family)|uniref:Redox-regulated ATPase YchF n=2 Tax=Haloferax volcanii TaxID=2246 RepID=A0A6C0UWM2_HALVO|nr:MULTISPECIES: redox-regulated ATPase YchF [Haloferax]ELK54285.1 translation-associated GTPase [Haloferax sp. BAB-2207]ELZ86222.1 translation-associated GTPase [Haloferax alexandrinus JCM 10717]NLV04513.1 redox-regulated ATPase YchF [Haloferax alexandrinus]QIB79966.1 redox-regulated ATPase YchF [Haloferax alexandrinus]RDZ36111.1 redox-regulated ATPase YchF [Haloferax sp. Atlit-47N]
MSYKIGLVGKPSVGKSSFFNAATMNDVPEGAYPFTTIDPSIGEAYVRVECAAPEFDESCTPSVGYCDHGMRFVPVKLVDVAGLIPGAHEGKGLGNQFLTDLNEADVLVHVVDFSGETDIEGEATEGHDPREDIDFLENELDMWYLGVLEKGIDRYRSGYHGEDKDIEVDLAEQMSAFKTNKDEIKQIILSLGLELDPDEWDDADKESLAREIRKRTKPIIIAANKMDKPVSQENYEEITADSDYEHLTFVPTSAHAEKALKKADEGGVVDYRPGDDDFDIVGDVSDEQEAGLEQIREFVTEFGGTGVQQSLENALFDVMGAIAIFPGSANGKSDSQGVFRDCFILPEGSTTEDFAYHLHSDIGDGLLHGIDCHSKRQIGSDHELSHRDVVEIVSTN